MELIRYKKYLVAMIEWPDDNLKKTIVYVYSYDTFNKLLAFNPRIPQIQSNTSFTHLIIKNSNNFDNPDILMLGLENGSILSGTLFKKNIDSNMYSIKKEQLRKYLIEFRPLK